jgi:DNA-binding transcriptional LysR family regulator
MDIDVDRLHTFIQLAQEGSFTASGKSLRKSQSAVSLQSRDWSASLVCN